MKVSEREETFVGNHSVFSFFTPALAMLWHCEWRNTTSKSVVTRTVVFWDHYVGTASVIRLMRSVTTGSQQILQIEFTPAD
jgi:hypothetical protein